MYGPHLIHLCHRMQEHYLNYQSKKKKEKEKKKKKTKKKNKKKKKKTKKKSFYQTNICFIPLLFIFFIFLTEHM